MNAPRSLALNVKRSSARTASPPPGGTIPFNRGYLRGAVPALKHQKHVVFYE
jgi:hypothetical protein